MLSCASPQPRHPAAGPTTKALLATMVLMLSACVSDQPGYGAGSGELGKGSLFVPCNDQDAACASGATRLEPQTPLAVGASFPLIYEGHVPNAPTGEPTTMILFSASPSMLSLDGDQFVAWQPGHVAVLARTQEGTVTDFVHLPLATIHQLALSRGDDDAAEHLTVGQQGHWLATPRGADGQTLGGRLAYDWHVEGTAIEITAKDGRSVTLLAREAGTATLRVSSGQAAGETTIVVQETP